MPFKFGAGGQISRGNLLSSQSNSMTITGLPFKPTGFSLFIGIDNGNATDPARARYVEYDNGATTHCYGYGSTTIQTDYSANATCVMNSDGFTITLATSPNTFGANAGEQCYYIAWQK